MASVAMLADLPPSGELERTLSEQECDLMIEALRRELDGVRDQLAWLTYHLDEEERWGAGEDEDGEEMEGEQKKVLPHVSQSSTDADARADTPRTTARKIKKVKEELERAAKAAAAKKEREMYLINVVDKKEEKERKVQEERLQLMQLCIERQRQQLQETSERLRRRMKRREKKEKAMKLQKKPVHFRSDGSNNTAFISKLHHSIFYQVVGIEHRMRKAGKLKGSADLKEFWDIMMAPPPPLPPPPSLPSVPSHRVAQPLLPEEEEEEEQYVNSWALTALPPDHHRQAPLSSSPAGRSIPTPSSRPTPLRLPHVHHITDILNQGSPVVQLDTPKQKERAHHERMRELEGGRRRVRHMYQQARSNEMAMRRLLPDIASLSLEGTVAATPPDLTPAATSHRSGPERRRTQAPSREKTGKKLSPLCTTSSPLSPPPPPSLRLSRKPTTPDALKKQSTPQSPSTPSPLTSHQVPSQPSRESKAQKKPLPLTMDVLLQNGDVKESKGKSALWSNYT